MKEDCRLGYLGLSQVVWCTFEHNVCYTEAQNLVRLFKHFSCSLVIFIKFLGHAWELRALTGEYICLLHNGSFIFIINVASASLDGDSTKIQIIYQLYRMFFDKMSIFAKIQVNQPL